jgi:hypothetical protein
MTWHTESVDAGSLAELIASIRDAGGIIISSRPEAELVQVTWTTEG